MIDEANSTATSLPGTKVPSAQVWGYGFLFVTIINMGAFAGVWVIPLMDKRMYKNVIMYLVSLAVGTLAGNALLSLIPESQGIFLDEAGHDFIWKNMVVLGGIYLFFNTERLLKIIASRRRARSRSSSDISRRSGMVVTAMHNLDSNPDRIGYKFTSPTEAMAMTDAKDLEAEREKRASREALEEGNGLLYSTPSGDDKKASSLRDVYLRSNEKDNLRPDSNLTNHHGKPNGHTHGNGSHHGHSHAQIYDGTNMIATVAYMIIFGDGLHNFIDGLAIGASFTNSVYQGISTSVAVICEEFPHELGDFAILLNSGMTVKQAVLANFLSACTCYLGLIFGIVLGENFHASEWIFALAGGMFLYISLVDMLPEINNVGGGDPTDEDQRSFRIFFIQNAGLLSGFGLMLILALFAGQIQV
ncbi:metal cation symporter ZIP14-like isoform X2 [Lytechinus variegatus]|uniref:metal cation symporter ZIP14-like isoform X2 n=1 Tax=Lytechinus variegatus TaxID=7654 RepID=UPI001BB157C1|nr:metal cation symporter ZIP14-like isoform X2 [Lytechinus variegatus]